ncbi:uncharacterized protein LOC126788400 [Argentina anserina]|uniref:uncharacterized protein LOC126788400 n=1 Tax=Argentina anserina TaxID=57926 RepID=UPI002176807F|nr:uncharacterized protein LOC126788400 [Potentilla anserina]
MDRIQHKFITVEGLKLHVADVGTGPNVVLFLHGFPEIWYSWRHQMIAAADAGFRAITPDYRGHGLSDLPAEPDKASYRDLVSDVLAILEALSITKVFVVAKDYGCWPAYILALLYPDRILGVVTLGVAYIPASSRPSFTESLPEGFYISRFREPGRAEADFGRFDGTTVFRNIYILFSSSEIPIAAENQEIMDLVDPSTPLPPWFSEEDLKAYGALYERTGFQTALQITYRSKSDNMGITELLVKVPVLVIIAEKDYFLKFPGIEDSITSGKVKEFTSDLELVYMPEGTHFAQEQFPDQFNQLMLTFLKKHI